MSDPRAGRTPSGTADQAGASGSGASGRDRRGRGRAPSGLLTDDPVEQRPSRPAWVELAAAMLIVTGATSLLQTIEAFAALADRTTPSEPLLLLSVLIAVGTIVLGILVRYGRAWLITVNVAAIAGFLELTSGTPQGLVLGLLDVIIVAILVANRPWFAWTPGGRRDDDERDDD